MRCLFAILVACAFHGLAPMNLETQEAAPPNRGGFTSSMGIPSSLKWSAGFSAGVHRRDGNEAATYLVASMYRDLLNPAVAAVGLKLEAYGGRRGQFNDFTEGWDGGGRIGVFSPVARLAFGADYNIPDGEFDFFLSLIHPLRRGGIFVDGGTFRLDYLPGRNHSTTVGVGIPVGQRFAGKTRPRQDYAVLSRPTPPVIRHDPEASMLEAVSNARQLSRWVNRLTVPFIDHWDSDWDEAQRRFVTDMDELHSHLASDGGDLVPGRRTPEAEVRAYHREMERAFSVAAAGEEMSVGESTPLGVEVWERARAIILDQVIFPYNRLLGQKKKNDSTRGQAARASAAFYEWLSRETPVNEERLRATAWVFAEELETIEQVRQANAGSWGDSRYVFLPYQLVLKPEEHDTQQELDALVERAVGEQFRPANNVFYVENEQFQIEFARMVREARDYSVLWIHDVRGLDGSGDPDEVAYLQVANVYLRALIDAVKAYDQTGKIPQHIIILDQWFFQANKGHLWMELLQNPLHHDLDLPDGFGEWEDNVASAQDELRGAVAGSRLLQAQALHFAPGWIENLVKVHVNITNPADVAFWTGELLPFVGLPDMIARDHRKIAFFDISEDDPYRGRAMYTGMGIGEHYVGAGWEDRALMARGPALLSLKYAARQLLLNQGFTEDEIPQELKPRPLAASYQAVINRAFDEGRARARAMQIHNQVGYAPKAVNMLKATLYTLMPPGSVIKAPDSLWNLPLWGAMMLGHALRGGRSLVIAPAIEHAPSAGFPQMSRAQEMLGRLVVAGTIFEDYLDDVGGLMKVGLYNPATDAGNTPAKMRALVAALEANPWLEDLYGMPRSTLNALTTLADELEAGGFTRKYQIDQEAVTPKLHLKAHMYATAEAWNRLMSGPEMEAFLTTFYRALAEQNRALSEGRAGQADMEALTNAIIPPGLAMIEAQLARLTPQQRERAALFLAVGSHNQNYRSFIMDGEVAFVVSSWSALHGLPDFITLAGLSTWVNDLEGLEALFPRYEGMQRKLGRWMQIVV